MILERIEYYLHYADVGQDADRRNYVVSYQKIRALGFNTTITLQQGIDELIRGVEVLEFKTPHTNL